MRKNGTVILASGSPRRKELCELMGLEFLVEVSDADENVKESRPDELVKVLALRKADAVFEKKQEDVLVIGSDTVVALGNDIMGKPRDREEAISMLMNLSGKTHQVYTGVALLEKTGDKVLKRNFYVKTDVTFVSLSKEEIESYVDSEYVMDKAGAYAIQGKSGMFISRINGDYYNVVGLPISALYLELKDMGWL